MEVLKGIGGKLRTDVIDGTFARIILRRGDVKNWPKIYLNTANRPHFCSKTLPERPQILSRLD
jgi:hypothetical protein